MAQAYHLYASLPEGPCPSVPRHLPPGPCGGGAGLGLTLACSPGHITPNDYGLTFDNSILCLSPSIHQRPVRAVVSMVSVCLHTHVYSNYFMEICDYIDLRFARSFLKVTLDSFSSSAPSIIMPGRHGREVGEPLACVFSHNPPWLLVLIALR